MAIATLIAAKRLSRGTIRAASDALAEAGIDPGGADWIEEGEAADIGFAGDLASARAALTALESEVDVVVQDPAVRRRKLLVADMDSTMITVECIDELADFAGLKPQVAEITERAMRGEIDFAAALRERVEALKGLPVEAIRRCYHERVSMTPGAAALVATMRANGAHALLVSGGFTAFAEPVAARLGFDEVVANGLDEAYGRIAGTVTAPIVDGEAKAEALIGVRTRLGLQRGNVLAVGDGANDSLMIEEAGLGIAYRAKPALAERADARIAFGDLSALLFAQGYPRAQWVMP